MLNFSWDRYPRQAHAFSDHWSKGYNLSIFAATRGSEGLWPYQNLLISTHMFRNLLYKSLIRQTRSSGLTDGDSESARFQAIMYFL